MARVRLSILIPNYNNGRGGSLDAGRSDLEHLFESLERTLRDDPVPLEIIVADDGSTDDSLATCRAWARRTWRGGETFCRLMEQPHTGLLSVTANRLTAAAAGAICCRLDGDVEMLTPRWASVLCGVFESGPPRLGIVGGKQLSPDGRIHSAGDWVLHPRGYHHIGQGADRTAVRRPRPVDHVMGCFYAHRRAVWDDLGGYDERFLRGQTIDFGLRARLRGWTTVCDPAIELVHNNTRRVPRRAVSDSADGLTGALDTFRRKWGFDRLAPDLDEVARRYAGTPLLWNADVFGPGPAWPAPSTGPVEVRHSEWFRFTRDAAWREAVLWQAAVIEDLRRRLGPWRRVGQLYCRAGLLCHLLARRSIPCVGIDPDRHLVDLARAVAARETYSGPAPRFAVQTDPGRLPLDDGALDALLLADVVERHPNPVGLFRRAHRLLGPGGVLVVITTPREDPLDAGSRTDHAYRPHELLLQLRATGCFQLLPVQAARPGPGPLMVAARRIGDAACVSVSREPVAGAVG